LRFVNMHSYKFIAVLLLGVAFGMGGCGGGGGSAGTTTSSTAPGTGNSGGVAVPPGTPASAAVPTPVAASFVYQLDKNTLTNSGTDRVALSVTALDASNNPVVGVPVTVALDSGIYTPSSNVTDGSGQVSGSISIGGNKTNRNINATLSVSGRSANVTVPVVGSQISLSSVPGTPISGSSVSLNVRVTDVNGSGIAGSRVTASGSLGFAQSLNTDAGGNVLFQIGAAPTTPGVYAVEVVASGVTEKRDVRVVAAGGVGVPDAVGVISSSSIAVSPNNIPPNTAGATSSRAGLRAVFQNSSNQPIQNVRVKFSIISPQLDSQETLSTGSAVVYSDASGVAIADYIPGTRSSPTNGVVIRACFGNTDAEILANPCTSLNIKDATLTVASQPLSITLGDNNLLAKGANELTYIKIFDIAVADSAGNAVSNALISASVDLKLYGKGSSFTARLPLCLNEDVNRNGFVDSEDKNFVDDDGNDILLPRKADVILSFIGSNTTGSNGRARVQVEYPQNVATWLEYAVKVTTNVAGSEGTVEKLYTTSFIEGDQVNGSFLTPPYGRNGCTTPN
jgi:hypothetical protein